MAARSVAKPIFVTDQSVSVNGLGEMISVLDGLGEGCACGGQCPSCQKLLGLGDLVSVIDSAESAFRVGGIPGQRGRGQPASLLQAQAVIDGGRAYINRLSPDPVGPSARLGSRVVPANFADPAAAFFKSELDAVKQAKADQKEAAKGSVANIISSPAAIGTLISLLQSYDQKLAQTQADKALADAALRQSKVDRDRGAAILAARRKISAAASERKLGHIISAVKAAKAAKEREVSLRARGDLMGANRARNEAIRRSLEAQSLEKIQLTLKLPAPLSDAALAAVSSRPSTPVVPTAEESWAEEATEWGYENVGATLGEMVAATGNRTGSAAARSQPGAAVRSQPGAAVVRHAVTPVGPVKHSITPIHPLDLSSYFARSDRFKSPTGPAVTRVNKAALILQKVAAAKAPGRTAVGISVDARFRRPYEAKAVASRSSSVQVLAQPLRGVLPVDILLDGGGEAHGGALHGLGESLPTADLFNDPAKVSEYFKRLADGKSALRDAAMMEFAIARDEGDSTAAAAKRAVLRALEVAQQAGIHGLDGDGTSSPISQGMFDQNPVQGSEFRARGAPRLQGLGALFGSGGTLDSIYKDTTQAITQVSNTLDGAKKAVQDVTNSALPPNAPPSHADRTAHNAAQSGGLQIPVVSDIANALTGAGSHTGLIIGGIALAGGLLAYRKLRK